MNEPFRIIKEAIQNLTIVIRHNGFATMAINDYQLIVVTITVFDHTVVIEEMPNQNWDKPQEVDFKVMFHHDDSATMSAVNEGESSAKLGEDFEIYKGFHNAVKCALISAFKARIDDSFNTVSGWM